LPVLTQTILFDVFLSIPSEVYPTYQDIMPSKGQSKARRRAHSGNQPGVAVDEREPELEPTIVAKVDSCDCNPAKAVSMATEGAPTHGLPQKQASFETMDLRLPLLRGVFGYGFLKPSDIQCEAIPAMMTGRDVIMQARSGTGKTGAFGISVLQRVDPTVKAVQALVLVPTMELATQVADVLNSIGKHCELRIACLVRGLSTVEVRALVRDAQIVVGTPGRVLDALEKSVLRVDAVRVLVLDEADKLLACGFQLQLRELIGCMPSSTQIGLFSATIPEETLELTRKFMRDPISLLVPEDELSLKGISQFGFVCADASMNTRMATMGPKLDCLCDLYECLTISQAVVFVNSRWSVDALAAAMRARDFPVSALHGEMDVTERKYVMQEFRSGRSRVLIATDAVSRGVDVQQVSLVINVELPKEPESYLHRVGRSGRNGRTGVAINLVCDGGEAKYLQFLAETYGTEMSGFDLCEADVRHVNKLLGATV
jgi:translation initiation factor 4A